MIPDQEAFLAWLATTPLMRAVIEKSRKENQFLLQTKPVAAVVRPKPSADADLLAALKSMA